MSLQKNNTDSIPSAIEFKYDEDGFIDWRKMIPAKFLVFNREKEEELVRISGKPLNELDKHQVEDKYLLILLGGIKHLLRLRGYHSVHQKVDYVSNDRAVSTCTITFSKNIALKLEAQTYSDTASASFENTNGFAKMFLEPIAANRAFVRCVRNYLNIGIVAQDEIKLPSKSNIGPSSFNDGDYNPNEPYAVLEEKSIQKGMDFEMLKKRVINFNMQLNSDPSKWSKFSDIPRLDCYSIMQKLGSGSV